MSSLTEFQVCLLSSEFVVTLPAPRNPKVVPAVTGPHFVRWIASMNENMTSRDYWRQRHSVQELKPMDVNWPRIWQDMDDTLAIAPSAESL